MLALCFYHALDSTGTREGSSKATAEKEDTSMGTAALGTHRGYIKLASTHDAIKFIPNRQRPCPAFIL